MKIVFIALLYLILSQSKTHAEEKAFYSANTRAYTLSEAFSPDSAHSPVMIRWMEGFSVEEIRKAYQNTNLRVDSIIEVEERAGHFFSKYSLFAAQVYRDSRESPKKAMSLLLPVFAIVFLGYILVSGVNLFLIRPKIGDEVDVDTGQ